MTNATLIDPAVWVSQVGESFLQRLSTGPHGQDNMTIINEAIGTGKTACIAWDEDRNLILYTPSTKRSGSGTSGAISTPETAPTAANTNT